MQFFFFFFFFSTLLINSTEKYPARLNIVILLIFKSDPIQHIHTSILKYKWHLPHTNNITKNKIVLGIENILHQICYEPNTLPFFSRKSKRKYSPVLLTWQKNWKALERSSLNWKWKTFTKQKNLMSLIYNHDFRPKIWKERHTFLWLNRIQRKAHWHQLELNTKPT